MVDTTVTPSRVFPLPGYTGAIASHGGYSGGSDIFVPVGTPIVSIVSGTVDVVTTQQTAPNSGGNAIEIKGQDGLTYYYAHMLNPPTLKSGDTVRAGQQIGAVDNTGNAQTTPSHLHIGIGHGISIGTGPAGGIGNNFDAVAMLRSLAADRRANDPTIVGKIVNPPDIQFVPSVTGFEVNHKSDIQLNLEEAIKAGIDPFLWLGIVSKESGFKADAVNPKSGACGYAQIYPCIPLMTPTENIQEGIRRLKGFLTQCNGNTSCALNLYSGGGGAAYSNDVLNRANAIKSGNPDIGKVTFTGTDSTQADTGSCPPISFQVGPGIQIPFPDILCILRSYFSGLQKGIANWWKTWQEEHIPNWIFVSFGILLILLGALGIAMQSGAAQEIIKMAPEAAAA